MSWHAVLPEPSRDDARPRSEHEGTCGWKQAWNIRTQQLETLTVISGILLLNPDDRMARKSASSSAVNSNGHLYPPSDEDDQPRPRRIIPRADREEATYESDWHSPGYTAQAHTLPFDPSLLPNGRRSLSSIAMQAFSLGFALALCTMTTVFLVKDGRTVWRLPAFFACLSAFHFLEFWTTAKFNMPAARASSFLLRNGTAYTFAHGLATTEIIVSFFLPSYQSLLVNPFSMTLGAILVILGQLLRSAAMAEAGTNFNHTPAKIKKEGHVLVTTGVYAWLRHPSYCAFFWWAIGTQVLVGNKISFVGYLFVLWNFFRRRIRGELGFRHECTQSFANPQVAEEMTLVDFFGSDYEEYRKRTPTGIPFVR